MKALGAKTMPAAPGRGEDPDPVEDPLLPVGLEAEPVEDPEPDEPVAPLLLPVMVALGTVSPSDLQAWAS